MSEFGKLINYVDSIGSHMHGGWTLKGTFMVYRYDVGGNGLEEIIELGFEEVNKSSETCIALIRTAVQMHGVFEDDGLLQ